LAAAAALRPDRIGRMSLDPQGFDFGSVESIRDAYLLPGSLRFGGLNGLRAIHSTQKQ